MLAKDLIKLLEEKIEAHKTVEDMMGPLEIVVDCFQKIDDTHTFHYKGWTPEIELEFDCTNANFIINAFAKEKDQKDPPTDGSSV